ncbi:MerR family transcriptional regulator [Enterocloster citroniae]|uniref:MerR family transcriptional regulator n=2 Tax=Enterocloster citroniae TaxID=358743 RepID=A0AA41K5U0_9FIRM|nr:MerR family transcriptional regulator [Enterocloster citroniae]MCC3386698.1 MerR family transcriptional regulator [Enterocloster citroniae]RGC13062.1 MerR family transcriptional regulator [Enterocloster citroniae]
MGEGRERASRPFDPGEVRCMKIGEFSREFQVPQHTIRYYVELGLLVPEVKNHQYSFNEDCRADMKLIEKSKAVGFPLKDIHKILSLRRLSNFASPEDSGQLALYMEERLRELEQEREQWEQRKRRLEKRIADLEP